MKLSVRSALVVFCVVVLVSAGSATTYGLFSDSEQASGTIQAADNFQGNGNGNNGNGNGNGGSSGNAYNDRNGNGKKEPNKQSYSASELANFDNESVNLVIPESVTTVTTDSGQVKIVAKSVTSQSDITAPDGKVVVTAKDGDVTIDGAKVESGSGPVKVTTNNGGSLETSNANITSSSKVTPSSSGSATLDGARVNSKSGELKITTNNGDSLQALNANLTSSSKVILTSTGDANFEETDINGDGQVKLSSDGDMRLTSAEIATSGQAIANLGSSGNTLYVDGAIVEDSDNTLRYSPSNTTVEGEPDSGETEPN